MIKSQGYCFFRHSVYVRLVNETRTFVRPRPNSAKPWPRTAKCYETETKNYENKTSPAKSVACESNTNWYDYFLLHM